MISHYYYYYYYEDFLVTFIFQQIQSCVARIFIECETESSCVGKNLGKVECGKVCSMQK